MNEHIAKGMVSRIHLLVERSAEQINGLANAVYLVSLCMRDEDPLCYLGVPALEAISDSIKDVQEVMLNDPAWDSEKLLRVETNIAENTK